MLEIEEVKVEETKEKKPDELFSYVTIPLKEYRKLIKAKHKYKLIIKQMQEEKELNDRLFVEKSKSLEEAKAQIAKLLGVEEDAEQA